jgi:serine/threonine protein kinase
LPDVGDRIGGKYRLTRLLGRGGMGLVFEAVHEQIGKAVAVKALLLPEGEDRAELVARFQQEAQAASAAGHRGIVDIHDVGVGEDGTPYLVMELLRGESLAELLSREAPLDVPRTAFVACQVLSALSAAHQAGVVHRDLKPENIYLAQSGAPLPEVKLLDFGISRVIPAGPRPASRA